MLRRIEFLIPVFLLALTSLPSLAGAADQPKTTPPAATAAASTAKPVAPITGVIDTNRILRESKAGLSLKTQLEDRQAKFRDEFAKIETELRGAEQELERQRSVLSPDAFEDKRQAFERRYSDAQRKADRSRRQLDDAFQTALKEIQAAMLSVTESIAQQMNLDLVLQRSQVIFISQDLDITEQVLSGLNAKLPSIKLTEGNVTDQPEQGGPDTGGPDSGLGGPAKGGALAPAAPAPAAPAPAPKK